MARLRLGWRSGFTRGIAAGLAAAVLSMAGLSVGCVNKPPPPPPPPPPVAPPSNPLPHRVQFSGETLGLIARWYTGKSSNWNYIVDANPGINPNRINLGDTIFIPEELLVRRDPMPKSAVAPQQVNLPAKPEKGEPSDEPTLSEEPVAAVPDTAPAADDQPAAPAAQDVSVDELLKELEANQRTVEQAPPPPPPAEKIDSGSSGETGTLGEKERDALLDELLSK